jgi:hypothetical protein
MYHGQGNNFNFGLLYTYYTWSGSLITTSEKHLKGKNDFHVLNTCKLFPEIELIEEEFEKEVGYFTVSLVREGNPISNELRYNVISDCFNKIIEFAFLNKYGGWESYNFNGETETEFKTNRNTIYKNQLPQFTISDEIESVNDVYADETFTVKSNYINTDTVIWLKELSTSKAVYELSTKRYILIDDFNVNYSTSKSKFQIEMKYHYSDTWNNNIQRK